uniref:Ribonuclease n=1 Tax=Populus trichocarpa TaxID=3694 RepID=A0A2K1YZD8_POPTR
MGSESTLPEWAQSLGLWDLWCTDACTVLAHMRRLSLPSALQRKGRSDFENLKANESIGWAVDVNDPRELSAKMLKKNKINLNEISHDSASGLVNRVLNMGVLLTEVCVDTVGDPEKYRIKLSESFPFVKFVVAKKAGSLYPVVSGASIVAKFYCCVQILKLKLGWNKHEHSVFGFPTLVRFSWGTCTPYSKNMVDVLGQLSVFSLHSHSNTLLLQLHHCAA